MANAKPIGWMIGKGEEDSFFSLILRLMMALVLFAAFARLYVDFVSVYFAYYGFAYLYTPSRLPIALFAIVALTPLLRPRIGEVASLTSTLCHFFFLIPTAVMFIYAGLFAEIFVWTVVIQTVLILISAKSYRFDAASGISRALLESILISMSVLGLALVIYQNGILSLNFNMFEVYERRALANVADTGLLGYFEQFGAQAALLLVAMAYYNRQLLETTVGIALCVLYFAYTGHKSTIFWMLFVIAFLYLDRFRNKFIVLVIGATICVWAIAISIETDLGVQLANYLVRRTAFTPVVLNHYYVLFAQQFGFLEWSYSKVGLGLFEYTDTVSPTQAVGHYLTGSDLNSANTGMIGSGYINAGHFGVAIYLAVFAAILMLASGLARTKAIEVLGAAVMMRSAYFAITTSDLPSTVLSGGLGYAVLFLLLYPRTKVLVPGVEQNEGYSGRYDADKIVVPSSAKKY